MRDHRRDWIASAMSFVRGHGGSASSNAPVGAAFVIGALVVAVLGLRWLSASGGSQDGTDGTPWELTEAGNVDTSTTIPASSPAKVVPIPDPNAADQAAADEAGATTSTTRPGVFLPGYSPTPGGGEGPTTTQGGGDPTPTTKPGGGTTTSTQSSTSSSTTSTSTPTTTSTTTTTTTPTESIDLSDVAQDRINRLFGALGWPIS